MMFDNMTECVFDISSSERFIRHLNPKLKLDFMTLDVATPMRSKIQR